VTQPYASFGVAAAVEPLSTSSANTLLQDADPALFYCLDFLSWVIANHPGPRLIQAAAAAGAPITQAVAQRYPYDPGPYFDREQFKFPLLAIYRTRSKYHWKRVGWDSDACDFELLYALPPMMAAQAERVLPILRAVESSVRHKTTYGFDPGYTPPGGSAGQQPWALAKIEEIDFNGGIMGHIEGTGNLWFPSLRMQGTFVERDMYVSNGNKFAGGDITADLAAPDGTKIDPFVQVATQQAPTITSLSVTTGPASGGTSVTITGTLFLSGPPAVLFGNQAATSVVWNSATSVTCVTPAMSGAGTVGVTLVNRDGQSATLANGFTFT